MAKPKRFKFVDDDLQASFAELRSGKKPKPARKRRPGVR